MRRVKRLAALLLVIGLLGGSNVWGQLGTEFTYQGELQDGGSPANGTYNLDISLWDAAAGGSQVGATNSFANEPVTDGRFTVELDFGATSLNGDDRWLEIEVNGTTLTPRQPVNGAPYAVQTRGIFVNDNETFVGIDRQSAVTGADVFSINSPATSGYGGMYISTDGQDAWPFYGYAAGGNADMWHYYNGSTGDWHLWNGGTHRMTIGNDGDFNIGTSISNSGGTVAIDTDALVSQSNGSVDVAIDALSADATGRVELGGNAMTIASNGFVGVGRDSAVTSAEIFGLYRNTTSFGGMYIETAGGEPFYGYSVDGGVDAYHYIENSTGDWRLINGGGTRLTVADDGYVGVGRNSPIDPTAKFEVNTPAGNNQFGGMFVNTTGTQGLPYYAYATAGINQAYTYYNGGTDKWHLWIGGNTPVVVQQNGRMGLSTFTPQYLLHCNGSAGKPGGGSWSNSSDRRLKKNIANLEGSLDKLMKLRGVSFEYLDPKAINELDGERIGVIAQEVEKVFPDWVDEREDGYKAVTFRGFEAVTVEALRELRAEKDQEIEQLESENDELRERLESLEAAVEALTAQSK